MDTGIGEMATSRSGLTCRHFVNGSCRFGSSCQYLHEWPAVWPPHSQICRYFQKGVCWFGESCRYLHITNAEATTTGLSRRGSAPSVHTSLVGHTQQYRRGSEPSLTQAQQLCSRGPPGQGSETVVANPQCSHGHRTTDITEENAEGSTQTSPQQPVIEESSHTLITDSQVSVQPCPKVSTQSAVPSTTLSAQAGEWTPPVSQQQECSSQGAAASARPDLHQTDEAPSEASSRSQDVTCGICMETVYEKANAEDRRFGILPNCCHSFCLCCIVTWRKTKNFQEDVVKACPQCRVKSAFYIPHKYWVEGEPKDNLIRNFKEKCSKRRCSFFMRHGGCPFKTECLYGHNLPHSYRPPRHQPSGNSRRTRTLDDLDNLQLLDYVIAMTLLDEFLDEADDDDDDDDEFPLPAWLRRV
ncbi:hypothetical protein DPEC_G00014300 [Dallia pectoralis]|uniref:Uncharacterized protein n=1 Tax=Dallia pectoralis TaxID=75939 RepID=A0ACC2HM78_DALPE|nr:hypothetical protein DPEC_G00014300 [Dallia pectoralis]